MRVARLSDLLAARELDCQRLRESNRLMLRMLEETTAADDIAIAELQRLGLPPDSAAFELTGRMKALIALVKEFN